MLRRRAGVETSRLLAVAANESHFVRTVLSERDRRLRVTDYTILRVVRDPVVVVARHRGRDFLTAVAASVESDRRIDYHRRRLVVLAGSLARAILTDEGTRSAEVFIAQSRGLAP